MKPLLTMLLAVALTACGSQAAQPNATPSTKLENEDLTDSLAGVDANGDGVRDDIEAHLKKRLVDSPDVRYWALELAKSETATLLSTTRQQAMESGQQGMQATGCLARKLPKQDEWLALARDITTFSFNTESRLRMYKEAWSLRGGGSFSTDRSVCSK